MPPPPPPPLPLDRRPRTVSRSAAISASFRPTSRLAVRYSAEALRRSASFSARSLTHSVPTSAAFPSSVRMRRWASSSRECSCWGLGLGLGIGVQIPSVTKANHQPTHTLTGPILLLPDTLPN